MPRGPLCWRFVGALLARKASWVPQVSLTRRSSVNEFQKVSCYMHGTPEVPFSQKSFRLFFIMSFLRQSRELCQPNQRRLKIVEWMNLNLARVLNSVDDFFIQMLSTRRLISIRTF